MANTIIQIKRSTASAIPVAGTLSAAEPAYSFQSDKLFIGNTAGTGIIEIGGKFYVDMVQAAYAHANAAYEVANTGGGATANAALAFDQANTARTHANTAHLTANAAYDQANTARTHANAAHLTANAGFDQANTARDHANVAYNQANVSYTHANAAHETANAGFDQANTARTHANTAHLTANAAYDQANTARDQANTAFAEANTKLSLSGGTITGNLSVVGSLSVAGNTYVIDAETLRVSDPLIYLAGNNYTSDIVDIGFVANYVNTTGQNVHTGFFRNYEDKEYYLFYGYDAEPDPNHIDIAGNNFTIAVLNADLKSSNIVLNGVNAASWITGAYVQANTARTHANTAHETANASFEQANTARTHANAAHLTANAGFEQANTARDHANVAFAQANTARTHANTAHETANAAYVQANTARTHANSAYENANAAFDQATSARNHANSAYLNANAAFDQANTANINAANASFLSVGTVPSSVISGSYTGITGVGTLTNGTWNADTITVPYGGTGMVSFTTNGILYGNGSGALQVTSAGTEGQVLQASATGVPQFSMLDGGTF